MNGQQVLLHTEWCLALPVDTLDVNTFVIHPRRRAHTIARVGSTGMVLPDPKLGETPHAAAAMRMQVTQHKKV
jgi:hypothetical protein